MKTKQYLLLALVAILCTGCGILGESSRQVMDQLLADGAITPEQHAAIVGDGYGELLRMLINTATTLLIGVPVIRTWRGPATKTENLAKKAELVVAKAKAPA